MLGTTEVAYKPIATFDKNHLEFLIPADNNTYIDLDIKQYIRGKLMSGSVKDVDFSDVTNYFLHSISCQCNVTLNGVINTQTSEHYLYRSYLETLMTYGSDAAGTHVSNASWYLDTGDMHPVDTSAENVTPMNNRFHPSLAQD